MAKVSPDTPGVDDPGPGRRLGLDVGTVRIGVAVSDRDGRLATPVETVPRETGLKDADQGDIDRLLAIIAEYSIIEIVVGLPRDLQGNGSASVKHAKEIAFRLKRRLGKPFETDPTPPQPAPVIRMGDERLTTVAATTALRASGVSEKKGRSVIDQAAAVEILQSWLDGRSAVLAEGSGEETGEK